MRLVIRFLATAVLACALFPGCANFRRLGEDLKFIDKTSIVSGRVTNASRHHEVDGIVIEWDQENHDVRSADYCRVGELGLFGFFVKSTSSSTAWADSFHATSSSRTSTTATAASVAM